MNSPTRIAVITDGIRLNTRELVSSKSKSYDTYIKFIEPVQFALYAELLLYLVTLNYYILKIS